jgi:hypothetical protein
LNDSVCTKVLWTANDEYHTQSSTMVSYLVDLSCFHDIFGVQKSVHQNISSVELFVANIIRGVVQSGINKTELSLGKLLHSIMKPSYISTIPVFRQQVEILNADLRTNAAAIINSLNVSHIFQYENISCFNLT